MVYTDSNIVICAPTGSGKTVILELAIVRLLISLNYNGAAANAKNDVTRFKVVYMAPLKALCSEKYTEWREKFERLHGLKCIELTGDTETLDDETDVEIVRAAHIICTTPEKWDVMTRRWKQHAHSAMGEIMRTVRLFLIDEIHVIGESSRGASIEAVVSRMKTCYTLSATDENPADTLRFVAISATIPNIDDVREHI